MKKANSTVRLNQNWFLRSEAIDCGPEEFPSVLKRKGGWFRVNLPCDIHSPLIKCGILKEPLESDNCFAAKWTEKKSWWFKKDFEITPGLFKSDAMELVMKSLDAEADIFLNEKHLKHQKSTFYPFRQNVKESLKSGVNTLLVRLTSGVEHYTKSDVAPIRDAVPLEKSFNRGDKRRPFVRKPQFVFGWDWGPRLVTCGITGSVQLEAYNTIAFRSLRVVTEKITGKKAFVRIEAEIENFSLCSTRDAAFRLEIIYGRKKAANLKQDLFLRSGLNYVTLKAEIENAKLWWPNGTGEQPLYTVKATVFSEGVRAAYPDFKFGIRTLELDQEKINPEERTFAFKVNGLRIFCKGANWIPADSIYARVRPEKYQTLLREAKEANFNMLRVWGGGIYETDIFYEECDRLGIMIWQDLMFACAFYPDYLEWFRQEAEKEIDYQTKRLRNHPALVLWCGNNENHWVFNFVWSKKFPFFGGGRIYNLITPRIVRQNCSDVPYWNSSPYGGKYPNDNQAGDKHHWSDGMMSPKMEKRITPEEYDKVSAKFVSEYGYVGPCRKSSVKRYHGQSPVNRASKIWRLHNNNFEKGTVNAGIRRHYTDPKNLGLDDYILFASLCQGLMLGYSLEAIRNKETCYGSLFWMYNDCWGETGWSIIDYYLKRKPSYYFVKRAFAPKKLILREQNGTIRLTGINDTPDPVSFSAEYGFVSFDGKIKDFHNARIILPPFSRKRVLGFKKPRRDFIRGCCFVRPVSENIDIAPAILRPGVFRKLKVPEPDFEISSFKIRNGEAGFTIRSSTFAHAVHFCLEDRINLSDEYFDLLPGEEREVTAFNVPDDFAPADLKPTCVVLGNVQPLL